MKIKNAEFEMLNIWGRLKPAPTYLVFDHFSLCYALLWHTLSLSLPLNK